MHIKMVNVDTNFVTLLTILFLICFIYFSIIPNLYGTQANSTKQCNCVIFRMDDIQDYWIEQGQIAPMDLFLSKNQSLSLGLIMNGLGNDSKIINKVKEGFNRGLFELALHGWNHTDYTKLSEQEQSKSLDLANTKLVSLFSNKSSIFIPPENAFNNDTLKAMQQNGIEVISTAGYAEDAFDGGKSIFNASSISINQSNGASSNHSLVFHLPETSSFKNYDQGKWIKNPVNSIISNVTDNINKYGYAVITLHPQDFVKSDNNDTFTNQVDENQIKDLSTLIDYFVSKNIPIASFSNISYLSNPAPIPPLPKPCNCVI